MFASTRAGQVASRVLVRRKVLSSSAASVSRRIDPSPPTKAISTPRQYSSTRKYKIEVQLSLWFVIRYFQPALISCLATPLHPSDDDDTRNTPSISNSAHYLRGSRRHRKDCGR